MHACIYIYIWDNLYLGRFRGPILTVAYSLPGMVLRQVDLLNQVLRRTAFRDWGL